MTNLTYAELAARAATSAQGLRDITARSSIRYEGKGVELDEVSAGEMDAEQQQRLITLLTERGNRDLRYLASIGYFDSDPDRSASGPAAGNVSSRASNAVPPDPPTSDGHVSPRKRRRVEPSAPTATASASHTVSQAEIVSVSTVTSKTSIVTSQSHLSVASEISRTSKQSGKRKAKPVPTPWTTKDFAKKFSTAASFAKHLTEADEVELEWLQRFKEPAPLLGVRAFFATSERVLSKQMAILMSNIVRMGGIVQDTLQLPNFSQQGAANSTATTHVIVYSQDNAPEPKFRDVLKMLKLKDEAALVGEEVAEGTSSRTRRLWVVKKSWVIDCSKQPSNTGTARKLAEMAHLVQCDGDKKRRKDAFVRNASRSSLSPARSITRDAEMEEFKMPGESQASTVPTDSQRQAQLPTESQLLMQLPASNETPLSFEDMAVEVDMARNGLDALMVDDDDDTASNLGTEDGRSLAGDTSFVMPTLREEPIDSDECPTDEEAAMREGKQAEKDAVTAAFRKTKHAAGEKYRCDTSNIAGAGREGPNEAAAKAFDQLANYYEKSKLPNAWWRVKGYRTAAGALRNVGRKIDTLEDARKLHGIGEKTAVKLMEIVQTGKSTQLSNQSEGDRIQSLFLNIYGIGPTRAAEMYNHGMRTLTDCEHPERYNLSFAFTEGHRLGLQYYEDLNERMPRSEVTGHFRRIKEIAGKIDPYLIVECMGSYRRGQSDCGDIDIIVTRNTDTDGKDHSGLVQRLVEVLFAQGVIRHTLSNPDDWRSLDAKWMGLLASPGGKMRRIDILGVPFPELGAALIYFTGNDIFNRSLRLKARHMGYSLNQRGLFKDVWRDKKTGEKKTAGACVASRTEEEIFAALNTKWRPPHERLP